MIRPFRFILVLVVVAGCASGGDELWRHRNVGRAYDEREATAAEAVEQFRQALALAPNSPRERIN